MPTKLDIKRKSFLKHPEPSVIPKYILWFKSNQNSASNYFRQVAKQIENSARLHKKKKMADYTGLFRCHKAVMILTEEVALAPAPSPASC